MSLNLYNPLSEKEGDNIDIFDILKSYYEINVSTYATIKRRVLNEYYIITSNNNKNFFLKGYPEKEKSIICESSLDRLTAITEYLVVNEIKTPKIIKTTNDKNCIKIANTWYMLYEYFPLDNGGKEINPVDLGKYVSQFHIVLSKAKAEPFDSWMLSVYDYKTIIESLYRFDNYIIHKGSNKYAEEEYYLNNRNKIQKYLENFDDYIQIVNKTFKKQFVHGDLHSENLINMRGDIVLIDLDSIHFGTILEDYATVTSHILCWDVSMPIQKEQYRLFQNNYKQRETFTSTMIFQGIIYDMLKNMANIVINWRLVSRFEVSRKVLLYIMKQIVLFMDNQDMYERLL